MKTFRHGVLRHCPLDDPDWFLRNDHAPPSRDDVPTTAADNSEPLVLRPGMYHEPGDDGPTQLQPFACFKAARPALRILQSAYAAFMRHLTGVEPEAGGMLLGPKGSSVVTHYEPDRNGLASAASFTLDAVGLNRVLKRFLVCDMDAKGLVHSHPPGCTWPSFGDIEYVRTSFSNPRNKSLSEFLLPIVCSGELHPYIVICSTALRVVPAELVLF